MRERKYKIGDIYNNRKVIGYKTPLYIVECLACGKQSKNNASNIEKTSCVCIDEKKLQAIKEKYKNGVTIEHIKEWIGG